MRSPGTFITVYTLTALALVMSSLLSVAGSFAGWAVISQSLITALIVLLAVLAVVIIALIFTQPEMSPDAIYGVFLFVGLASLLFLLWLSPLGLATAALAFGYALAFLLGDVVILAQSTEGSVQSAPWSSLVQMLVGQQQQENARREREIAERRNERAAEIEEKRLERVEMARREAEERLIEEERRSENLRAQEELKQEIERTAETVRQEEEETKRALQKQISELKKSIKAPEEKKTFFVASKTGKSLHKPNCIALGQIPKKNRITFDDHKTAVKQGYKLCRVCHPTGKV